MSVSVSVSVSFRHSVTLSLSLCLCHFLPFSVSVFLSLWLCYVIICLSVSALSFSVSVILSLSFSLILSLSHSLSLSFSLILCHSLILSVVVCFPRSWLADGRRLLVGTTDCKLLVVDAATAALVCEVSVQTTLLGVDASPTATDTVAAAGPHRPPFCLHLPSAKVVYMPVDGHLTLTASSVALPTVQVATCVRFSPSGAKVYTGTSSGRVLACSVHHDSPATPPKLQFSHAGSPTGHPDAITSLAVARSPPGGGGGAASASSDVVLLSTASNRLLLADGSTLNVLVSVTARSPLRSVALSADGKHFAAAHQSGRLQVWAVSDGTTGEASAGVSGSATGARSSTTAKANGKVKVSSRGTATAKGSAMKDRASASAEAPPSSRATAVVVSEQPKQNVVAVAVCEGGLRGEFCVSERAVFVAVAPIQAHSHGSHVPRNSCRVVPHHRRVVGRVRTKLRQPQRQRRVRGEGRRI